MSDFGRILNRLQPIEAPAIDPAFVEQYDAQRVLPLSTRLQTERLRDDSALRALTDTLRNDDAWHDIAPFVDRRADFQLVETRRRGGVNESRPNRTRFMAPLLAGVLHVAPEIADMALWQHTQRSTDKVAERLKASGATPYVPAIVAGAGPQSQIFNSELQASEPGVAPYVLTVERTDEAGGTFRSANEPGFGVNSRTRPQTLTRPQPGTAANLNDLRPGTVSPADFTTQSYINARDLGRAVGMNHALSSTVMGSTTVRAYAENIAPRAEYPGKMFAMFTNNETGEDTTITTDAIVSAGGLGREDIAAAFGNDPETVDYILLERAAAKMEGRLPRVVSSTELIRHAYDPANDFPFKGIDTVAVVGDGDSGAITLGVMFGYEDREDNSVTQLDFIKKAYWLGQEAQDVEDYVRENRLRYSMVGLEFPRPGTERYSRIVPVNQRAVSLEAGPGRQVSARDSRGNRYTADLVVVASGFQRNLDVDLASRQIMPLNEEETFELAVTLSELAAGSPRNVLGSGPLVDVGTIIEYPDNQPLKAMQVLSVEKLKTKEEYRYTVQVIDNNNQVAVLTVAETKSGNKITLEELVPIDIFRPGFREAKAILSSSQQRGATVERNISLNGFESASKIRFDRQRQNASVEELEQGHTYIDLFTGLWGVQGGVVAYDVKSNGFAQSTNGYAESILRGRREGLVVLDRILSPGELMNTTMARDEIDDIFSNQTVLQGTLLKGTNDAPFSLGLVTTSLPDGTLEVVFANPGQKQFQFRTFKDQADLAKVIKNQCDAVVTPNPESTRSRPDNQVTTYTANELSKLTEQGFNQLIDNALEAGHRPLVVGDDGTAYLVTTSPSRNRDYSPILDRFVVKYDVEIAKLDVDRNGVSLQRSDRLRLDTKTTLRIKESAAAIVIGGIPRLYDNATPPIGIESAAAALDRPDQLLAGTTFTASKPQGSGSALVFIGEASDGRLRFIRFGKPDNTYPNSVDVSTVSPAKWREYIRQGRYDTVLVPGSDKQILTQRVSGSQINLDVVQEKRRLNEDLPSDTRAEAVARKIGKLPVFTVGPAAEFTVDPALVELIPDISENTVGIFSSAERVRSAAKGIGRELARGGIPEGAVAIGRREKAKKVLRPVGKMTDFPATALADLPAEDRVRTSKGTDPALAMRYGLLEEAVSLGWTAANKRLGRTRFEVSMNADGQLVALERSNFLDASSSGILSSPIVATMLQSMVRGGKTVEIDLVFDQRGLDARNIRIASTKRGPRTKAPRQTKQ